MSEDRGAAVRAQYERWVYPQPIEDLGKEGGRNLGAPIFHERASSCA